MQWKARKQFESYKDTQKQLQSQSERNLLLVFYLLKLLNILLNNLLAVQDIFPFCFWQCSIFITWSFIPTPFMLKTAFLRKVYFFLQSARDNLLITLIGHNSDPSHSSLRACRSINKQVSIDLLWIGKVITGFLHSHNHQCSQSRQQHCTY